MYVEHRLRINENRRLHHYRLRADRSQEVLSLYNIIFCIIVLNEIYIEQSRSIDR